jgi:ATP-binding cassette subfamily G (WHITE) protein 2 (SNQ2)
MMTNEFHTLDGQCSTLVPSGPGYEGVSLANQVCTVVGSVPGQSTVNGNTYLGLSYAYYHKNLWRVSRHATTSKQFTHYISKNYGIIVAYGVGFLLCLLIFTEINTGHSGQGSMLLFKRGSDAKVVKEAEAAVAPDEEKAERLKEASTPKSENEDEKAALAEQPKMTNTFSWRNLKYTVTVSGERKCLLDNVSGFVAPGKLTALMGESGAGKVCYILI